MSNFFQAPRFSLCVLGSFFKSQLFIFPLLLSYQLPSSFLPYFLENRYIRCLFIIMEEGLTKELQTNQHPQTRTHKRERESWGNSWLILMLSFRVFLSLPLQSPKSEPAQGLVGRLCECVCVCYCCCNMIQSIGLG